MKLPVPRCGAYPGAVFISGSLAAAAAYGAWHWIRYSPAVDGIQKPLRNGYKFNSEVSRYVLGDSGAAPTFSVEKAVKKVRLNGNIGIDPVMKLDTWKLQVTGIPGIEGSPNYVADVNTYKTEEDKALMEQDPDADAYGSTGGSLDEQEEAAESETRPVADARPYPRIAACRDGDTIEVHRRVERDRALGWSALQRLRSCLPEGHSDATEICRPANAQPRILRRSFQG